MATPEAVELTGQPKGRPLNFTCKNGSAIEKYDLLWFEDDNSVSGASTTNSPFAGIAAEEKVAGDGATTIGVFTEGVFDISGANTTVAGSPVVLSGQNTVVSLLNCELSGSLAVQQSIVGRAMEAGSDEETIKIAVGIYPCGGG